MSASVLAASGSENLNSKKLFAAKRGGRPLGADPSSERSCQPWLDEGISHRTFYRRKAVAAAEAPPPPVQHAAHVLAWFATLDVFAQLDHRAKVRRWERDARKAARQPEHDVLRLYAAATRVLH